MVESLLKHDVTGFWFAAVLGFVLLPAGGYTWTPEKSSLDRNPKKKINGIKLKRFHARSPTTKPAATEKNGASSGPQVNVFAVHGVEPEVQAYAMAKYSRSALSMKESLKEISEQKAEQFLNTFYFQYGHRSIADLAHLAFAIEKLSILAAIVLVDEQRWDGQERSTRYQNFKKSGYFIPDFGS